MKASFLGALVVCLLLVGCAPSGSRVATPGDSSAVSESSGTPPASESTTFTVKGWFAQGGSARIETPGTGDPSDAIGYFAVSVTGDDPAERGNGDTARVFVTAETRVDMQPDPLDANACDGRWIWADCRREGEQLVAERVYAPVGVAY